MTEHTADETFPVLVALTCDRCGKRHDDVLERQEFLRWKDTGGYGNMAFGDMCKLELDLCQHCVKDTLGQWVRVDGVPGGALRRRA
jgi:hypothetical protein